THREAAVDNLNLAGIRRSIQVESSPVFEISRIALEITIIQPDAPLRRNAIAAIIPFIQKLAVCCNHLIVGVITTTAGCNSFGHRPWLFCPSVTFLSARHISSIVTCKH
ncbi:hypothetical protein Vretifemale_483, partial [Volvox reticuliferus]